MGSLVLRRFIPATLLLVLVLIVVAPSCIDATRLASKKGHRKSSSTPPAASPTATPSPSPPSPEGSGTTFNVLDYGAKGDGSTDDTEAFQAAWSAACDDGASSNLVIPSNLDFLVGPISFSGPCKSTIVFQLDGTITAPTSAKAWGSGLLQWLEFRLIKGIKIQGQGTIEGEGSVWWSSQSLFSSSNPIGTELSGLPRTRPTAVRFYGSSDVTVSGVKIQNSPQAHLKFDSCQDVEVFSITISSPGDSPNTDGIHLQNSVGVSIHDTDLSCGDDCISIQTGCSNVFIRNVNCGPGHGISIGGLGKANTRAAVSNVTVQNANMVGTMTAVRIKTWQGGSGYVKGIRFSKIKASRVRTPVVIDQFYCDQSTCKNQTSAVEVSDITYDGIDGTYTVQPVYLACSDNQPCESIHLNDIQLQLDEQGGRAHEPFCWNVHGDVQNPVEPPIDCLQS